MATRKDIGAVSLRGSGKKTRIDVLFPSGTRLRAALRVIDIVKAEAVRKFQPGPCTMCISGRDFRLRDIAINPATFTRNMAAFNVRTGKLLE